MDRPFGLGVWGAFWTQARSLLLGIPPRISRTYAMTWEGVFVIVLMAVVGLAAWNSGTNLLYLVLATMIGMFLAHGLFALHFMNGLVPRRALPPEATAGEPVVVMVTVENTKRWLPSFAVNVRHYASNGEQVGAAFCPIIPRRGVVEIPATLVFPHRGSFALETYGLYSRFPFGFAVRGYSVRDAQSILILPQTYGAKDLLEAFGLDTGEQGGGRRGDGVEPHSLREYHVGEHVRAIHWRTSARLGRPVVLEHVLEEAQQVEILLPLPGDADRMTLAQFEKAVVLVASLARALVLAGFDVGIGAGDAASGLGHGPAHLRSILRFLALLPGDPSPAAVEPAASHGTAMYRRGPEGRLLRRLIVSYPGARSPGTSDTRSMAGFDVVDVRQWQVSNGEWKLGNVEWRPAETAAVEPGKAA